MSNESDQWKPCPEGELGRMVGELRTRRRNFVVNRVAAVAATVTVAIAAFALFAPLLRDSAGKNGAGSSGQSSSVRPISCREVRELLPGYAKKQLDPKLMARVERHLEKCRECRRHRSTIAAAGSRVEEVTESKSRRVAMAKR
jgi:hypothetical protein